jgi:hypothetical protein
VPVPPVFVIVFGEQAKGALDDVLLMVLHVPFAQSHFALIVSSEDSVPMLKLISMIDYKRINENLIMPIHIIL